MLEPLGLGPEDELVYRALLHRSPAQAAELARELEVSTGRVRAIVTRLIDHGLVESGNGTPGYVAVDPRLVLPALVRDRRSELDRVDRAVDELHAEFRERAMRSDPAGLVEIIEGPSVIADQITVMLTSAQLQVRALDSPPYVTPAAAVTPVEHSVLARGVPCRAIYAAAVLDLPDYFQQLREVALAGEQARIMPHVPMKMIIADDHEALLPLTASDSGTRSSAVLVRASRLLDALVSLFELLWGTAVPVFDDLGSSVPDDIDAVDLAVLRLLHSGLKDDAIARQLGVSERTLRRRITDLLGRLGATSRFQAGAQAVRRGWL